jgi:very-short-patch-repair endonuclease
MLRWKEDERLDKIYRAPLILLPVQLIRSSARSPIRIRQIPDEEPIFNTTLIEFLSQDYEIDLDQFRNELPKDDSGINVPLIWSVVRQKIKDVPGFEVVEDLVLSTFSFAKYLMWRDLRDRLDDLKSNLFVEHMIERPTEIYQQNSRFVDKKEVDTRIKPSDIYAPLNADSSQVVAIEASGHAQDFVMEGPPGTGKSETIANIICHNLALGRRVLFVAEKMAALNVVYKRLNRVGVGNLCLELHSNKANKASVLEQLRKSWQGRYTGEQSDWEKKAQDLFKLRGDLNRYVDELHKPSVLGITPRKAISRSVRLANHNHIKLDWPGEISQSPIKDKQGYILLLDAARDLGLAYKDLDGLDTSALGLIHKHDWSNAWQSDVIACARKLNAELRATKTAADLLIAQIGLDANQSITMRGLFEVCALGEFIGELKNRPLGVALSGKVRDHLENLQRLIDEKRKIDNLLDESEAGLGIDDILKLPTANWADKLAASKAHYWPLSAFTRMSLRSAMKKSGVMSYRNIEVANTLDHIRQQCSELVGLTDTFVADKIWHGWETRPVDLESSKYLVSKRSSALRSLIHELGIEPVVGLSHLQTKLATEWEFLDSNIDLLNKAKTVPECREKLDQALASFKVLAESEVPPESSVDDITMKMDALVSGERVLNAWCNWLSAKRVSSQYGLDVLAEELENGLIKHNDAQEVAKTAVHTWVAPILIDSCDVLKRFSASSHEALIEDFCKLDEEVARTTAEYIIAKASASVPDPGSSNTPVAYGVLSNELQKRSKHKPIRQLIEEMGEAILNLTPCMMMSPLSVAQYLPTAFNAFDLVVFDEASQITVYDAVGAIARGKNSIIVGDPHQMPPTNFFNRSDDNETDDFDDLESILDQALAAKVPLHRLTGHYRSRHESLIAFSNNRYYKNELVTYPSADTKDSTVYFHKINGQYSKGVGRNNVIEARAVADEIVHRLTDRRLQKLSIGVVALNSEQQRAIEDELDSKRRANSEIESFFNGSEDIDPVFVKNLESVQGDERDVIFLSLGYGPTEPGAKTMSMNFGPLNRAGGERRLNVAITRATTEVHVFSSFTPDMIDLSRTQAEAIKDLKGYLEFAEKGPEALASIASAENGVDQFDSDFEQSVAYQLREKGWKVQTQVGVGKFRIDMGVIHPDHPGRYMAGIECDGATYHQSPAARDRDRVRQIILENLGWTIVRLWSTDYFINPEHAIDKIDQRLKQILEISREQDTEMDDQDRTEESISADKPVAEVPTNLDKARFFDTDYQPIVLAVVQEILEERNGISLTELVSEVSRRFGLSRSSSLQQDHIYNLILPWAGLSDYPEDDPTVWMSQDDMTDFIEWRGLAPWGVPRKWQTICYHEQLGAVQAALKQSYQDSVSVLKDMFNLSRLNTTTREEFERWVKQYTTYIKQQTS